MRDDLDTIYARVLLNGARVGNITARVHRLRLAIDALRAEPDPDPDVRDRELQRLAAESDAITAEGAEIQARLEADDRQLEQMIGRYQVQKNKTRTH